MAEQKIVGVDFSGAKTKNTTQMTMAVLEGHTLKLQPLEPLPKKLASTHEELKNRIQGLPDNAVVAMDFPFSVPRAFAEKLAEEAEKKPPLTMPDLWSIVAKMDYPKFKKSRDSFVKNYGEIMRRGDANYGGPFSPLHEFNPSMLQMTFYGMQMLCLLRREAGCRVPPLPDGNCNGPILLETMPGVLLRFFKLPFQKYKTGYKHKTVARHNREKILHGLLDKETSGVSLENLDQEPYLKDDDLLDSLVAAIGAARWAMDESKNKSTFLTPGEPIDLKEELDDAKLEGWIYAPKKPQSSN